MKTFNRDSISHIFSNQDSDIKPVSAGTVKAFVCFYFPPSLQEVKKFSPGKCGRSKCFPGFFWSRFHFRCRRPFEGHVKSIFIGCHERVVTTKGLRSKCCRKRWAVEQIAQDGEEKARDSGHLGEGHGTKGFKNSLHFRVRGMTKRGFEARLRYCMFARHTTEK